MRKHRKELNDLRYEIQRTKGVLNSLSRENARRRGGKEFLTTKETDMERLTLETGMEYDETTMDYIDFESSEYVIRPLLEKKLAQQRARAAYLKHQIDNTIPITPWGFAFFAVKVLIRKYWPRNTRPRHRHDRKRRRYKTRKNS